MQDWERQRHRLLSPTRLALRWTMLVRYFCLCLPTQTALLAPAAPPLMCGSARHAAPRQEPSG